MAKTSMQELIDWLDPSFSSVIDKAKELLEKEKQQSEPLPDSESLTKEEILYKHSSNSMTKYPNQIRTEVLAAMEEYKNQELAAASTVSEPLDAISFVEWFVSDNNPYPDKYSSDDDNDGKWHDSFSEGINRHYYTTEQLYQLYRKQSKQ